MPNYDILRWGYALCGMILAWIMITLFVADAGVWRGAILICYRLFAKCVGRSHHFFEYCQ